MKRYLIPTLCLALVACQSPSRTKSSTGRAGSEPPAETAKSRYWQLQQSRPDAETEPRYRRLTITIPAHTEAGVNYDEQTRTILIAE